MSTRCKIIVSDGYTKYSIYRHYDGYPEGVLADVKAFMENYHDPKGVLHGAEYWLANFMFYAKLSYLIFQIKKGCEENYCKYGYGICDSNCEYGDLKYIYEINLEKETASIKEWDWGTKSWFNKVENMPLQEAFQFITDEFKNGCHITKEAFNAHKILKMKKERKLEKPITA